MGRGEGREGGREGEREGERERGREGGRVRPYTYAHMQLVHLCTHRCVCVRARPLCVCVCVHVCRGVLPQIAPTHVRAHTHTYTDGRAVEAAICSTTSAMKPIVKVHPINTL